MYSQREHFVTRYSSVRFTESRGRVVTRWPGSQEVGGSIPGCATKICKV